MCIGSRLTNSRRTSLNFRQLSLLVLKFSISIVQLLLKIRQFIALLVRKRRLQFGDAFASLFNLCSGPCLVFIDDNQRGRSFVRLLPLEIHAAEERSEVVIIILRVPFQRMVVTLGTSNTSSQKRLSHGRHNVGIFDLTVLADGHDIVTDLRLRHRIAGRCDHIPSDLVPRTIVCNLLANPRLHGPHALASANIVIALLAILQQIAQYESPIIDILGSFEQSFDLGSALVRTGVGEKDLHFFGSWQRADCVEISASQKSGIACIGGRRNI